MLHRYACTALEELRAALNNLEEGTVTISKRHMSSLVEELQTAFNRMETELEARGTTERLETKYNRLKAEVRDLRQEKRDIKNSLLVSETELLRDLGENIDTKQDDFMVWNNIGDCDE